MRIIIFSYFCKFQQKSYTWLHFYSKLSWRRWNTVQVGCVFYHKNICSSAGVMILKPKISAFIMSVYHVFVNDRKLFPQRNPFSTLCNIIRWYWEPSSSFHFPQYKSRIILLWDSCSSRLKVPNVCHNNKVIDLNIKIINNN